MTFASRFALILASFAIATAISATPRAALANGTTLYAFRGGADGAYPFERLTQDAAGNFYGTTSYGGGACQLSAYGCGTAFQLTSNGRESVLHSFVGGCDGATPYSGLTPGTDGAYYGTTFEGGDCNGTGLGTVFKLAADGTERVLHSFKGGKDGEEPSGDLVADEKGNLYGTTSAGGLAGCGTVFEITSKGKERILYAFKCGDDGGIPFSGLLRDKLGNLYGTTLLYGSGGYGTVFKITPDNNETVLYTFHGSDGAEPLGILIMDKVGVLYGTTFSGGFAGAGTVFSLAQDGTEIILHAFQGGLDGLGPRGGLVMDKQGNLYGTTSGSWKKCRHTSCGTVFKLAPDGTKTALLTFGGKRGSYPNAGLILSKNGALYGTTARRGTYKNGTVFEVKK